jgi:hypothetical protein
VCIMQQKCVKVGCTKIIGVVKKDVKVKEKKE